MPSKVIRNITKVFRSASGVLFGRVTAGTGRGEELTPADVRTLISVYSTSEVDTIIGGIDGLTDADIDTLAEINAILTDADLASVSYVNGLASNYATAAQGSLADSALQPADIASGTITPRSDDVNLSGGSDGDVLTVQADGSLALETPSSGGGIDTLGTSGTDLNISGSTLNVPDAGASARGVVSTAAQTFAGKKTLAGGFETYVANIMAGGASTGYTGPRDILCFKYGSGSTNYCVVSDQSGAIAFGSPAQKMLLNVFYATGEDRVTVGIVGPQAGRSTYGMLTVFSPSVAGSSRTFCVANGYNAVTYYVTDGGNQTMSGHLTLGAYTVGTLPSASANAGAAARVTDSSVSAAGNYGAVVAGGGSGKVKVFSDGTNWIIA